MKQHSITIRTDEHLKNKMASSQDELCRYVTNYPFIATFLTRQLECSRR